MWDTADKFTRDTLGFSVLHVVRDNPTSLIASGCTITTLRACCT